MFQETSGQVNQTYNYDGFGNRWISPGWVPYTGLTPIAYVFSNNRWADGSGVNYDSAGNQKQIMLTGSGSPSFTYDAENRLASSSINGYATTYLYDGDGRRVQKTVTPPVGSAVTTVFVYDAMGHLAAEYGGPTPPVAGTNYLTTDHLGSTRLVTDASELPLRRYDYAPFGEELPAGLDGRSSEYPTGQYPTATADALTEKFTSKERDSETGLDFFGARYMSSAQGRFTSPDPDNFDARLGQPQSWNMYAYTWNNPLKFTDDDGRAVNLLLAGVGAGVGFVTNFAGSAISQQIRHGNVNWTTASKVGAVGAATGSLAWLTFGGSLVVQALSAVAIGTAANVANGIGSRAVSGETAFDESAIESDFEIGLLTSAGGAALEGIGTAIASAPKPKLPSPLGTVQKQLQRLALTNAWKQQQAQLSNRFSAASAVGGSLVSNTGTQIKQGFDLRQNDMAYLWLQQQSAAAPRQKPVRACVTTDATGGGKETVCQ